MGTGHALRSNFAFCTHNRNRCRGHQGNKTAVNNCYLK